MCKECNGRHKLRDSMGRYRKHGSPFMAPETLAAQDYAAYIEAVYTQAEEAVRGHMLSRAGLARGVRPSAWFDGRRAVSDRYASEELLAWFRVNGRPLDKHTFTLQCAVSY